MKSKAELQSIIDQIASDESPVGMDAVYVHALILEKLSEIEGRLARLEGVAEELPRELGGELSPSETNPERLR